MRALISQSDPNGQILGRAFGKTHFHQCGFNVSVAICLCRLIYSVETELSGELMRPSNDSWKRIRTSLVPVPLPTDGCRYLSPCWAHPGSQGQPWSTGGTSHSSLPSLLPPARTDPCPSRSPSPHRAWNSSIRRVKIPPALISPSFSHLQQRQDTNQATKVMKNTALFVFKHDIHGGFTVCMLQHALFLAPCLLKLGPLFSTVYQDQYV